MEPSYRPQRHAFLFATHYAHLTNACSRDRCLIEGGDPALPVRPEALLQLSVKLSRRHHIRTLPYPIERLRQRRRNNTLVLGMAT